MPMDTMALWVGFGGLGITMLTVGIALAGLLVNLMNQQERRSEARMDRLENQIAELRAENARQIAEVNQRLDGMDGRMRGLEQGQAHLSGEFSALKDFFTHRPREE